jgi:hypothetical protein
VSGGKARGLIWRLRVRSRAWWFGIGAELIFFGLALAILHPGWGGWFFLVLWAVAHIHVGSVERDLDVRADEIIELEQSFQDKEGRS